MSDVSTIDLIGFAAAGLLVPIFCLGSIRTLRRMGIAGNVAVIAPRCCLLPPFGYGSTPIGRSAVAEALNASEADKAPRPREKNP